MEPRVWWKKYNKVAILDIVFHFQKKRLFSAERGLYDREWEQK